MSEETIKLIEEKIEELYNSLMEKPLQVLDIFNDFFGEKKVDMQEYIDLKKFKLWMSLTHINRYILDRESIDIFKDDWSIYQNKTIEELPIPQAIKVLNSRKVKREIGLLKFNDIFILVHFPHVRVTNEHNRFVDINHLWAKVKVSYNGTLNGSFTLNRSEYTMLHMSSNYLHSHVSNIPKYNFTEFQTPCTGNGPINGTISALNIKYAEDTWKMFCLELSKYVTVESITGRPYNYLENIGINNMKVGADSFTTYTEPYYWGDVLTDDKVKEFVKYFISKKKLKFNYLNGSYSIGMSLPEYIILISNEFISWYNNLFNNGETTVTFYRLKKLRILNECIIDNGKIYYENSMNNVNNCLSYIGKKVCTFKGREVTINITDIAKVRNENMSITLNTHIALYILTIILKVLNYRYGRKTDTSKSNQPSTKVRYL